MLHYSTSILNVVELSLIPLETLKVAFYIFAFPAVCYYLTVVSRLLLLLMIANVTILRFPIL